MGKKKMLEHRNWDVSQSIGIDLFDKHHKNFIDIINLLIDAINKDEYSDSVAEVFHKLIFYAENYFIDEELYFKKYNYTNAKQHQDSHELLMNQINKFYLQFKDGKKGFCSDMLNYIENWFKEHLQKYDKDTVNFLIEKGAK
jgi:hemerythrin-like metal-binding protein